MVIHWAPDDFDATKTACNELVGYILTETGDEVTPTEGDATCRDCRDLLDEEE